MENKWNLKYSTEPYDFTPNATLAQILQHKNPPQGATALDLACGGGRNSLLLAANGWRVDAWDLSEPGIRLLLREATERGLSHRIQPRVLDLEAPGVTLPVNSWDLVVNAFFLHRPLLDQIPPAVRPGGWVFVQTFVNLGDGGGKQVRPEFRLASGELRARFSGWRVTVDEENGETGVATYVAQKPW